MSLSDKRKELLNDFEWTRQRYDKLKLVNKIFKMIEEQDKEAIKELKKKRYCTRTGIHICDKHPEDCDLVIDWEDVIEEIGKELIEE